MTIYVCIFILNDKITYIILSYYFIYKENSTFVCIIKPQATLKSICISKLVAGKNTTIFPHSYLPVTPIPSIPSDTVYPNISNVVNVIPIDFSNPGSQIPSKHRFNLFSKKPQHTAGHLTIFTLTVNYISTLHQL